MYLYRLKFYKVNNLYTCRTTYDNYFNVGSLNKFVYKEVKNMRMKLYFTLENEKMPIDYRRSIISFIKLSLSEYSENEFKKYYNQKDNIIKPYAFSIFFRQPQINGQEIILEDKRFEMNMTIENYETAITIYNAFNHQKNKKFLINQNSWILQNIVLIPEKEIKDNKIVIKFQAPLCVRKREENKDYYYSFEDEKFEETLKMNVKEQLKITTIPAELVDTLKIIPIKAKKVIMDLTMVISIILAMGNIMVFPTWVSTLMKPLLGNGIWMALFEGVLRIAIFIAYVGLISLMPDIKRTYMYHGAEHKCINCIEHGLPLTVENVMKSSKEHKRCGTSFLLIVMVISILFFLVIRPETLWLRLVSRILLIPVIAGVSFEFLRLAGNSDNPVVNLLSKPGLMLQGLTTTEPDEKMAEVAICAVEAVFDWKAYEEANFN